MWKSGSFDTKRFIPNNLFHNKLLIAYCAFLFNFFNGHCSDCVAYASLKVYSRV